MQTILLAGSNLGDREKYISLALNRICEAGKVKKKSQLYETQPWGFSGKADFFLNQAILLETDLSPVPLLYHLQQIETELGRTRSGSGYESRTVDIDILFYEQEIIHSAELILPHPRLHLRRFVLAPTAEICPGWVHPVINKTLSQLLEQCTDDSQVKIYLPGKANI